MNCGKRVGDDIYAHLSCLNEIQFDLTRTRVSAALNGIGPASDLAPNVFKLNQKTDRLSLLAYADFDEAPFPELVASWSFGPGCIDSPTYRTYSGSLNPPILHRKELLVLPTHPDRQQWVERTRAAEELGFFDNPLTIGFRLNWHRLITGKGFRIVGNEFQPIGNEVVPDYADAYDSSLSSVNRHLTALNRSNISAPVQLLLRHKLLQPGQSFFDYGCGRGGDIFALNGIGVYAAGWDPHYASNQTLFAADAVNLGFVVNVIEDPAERVEAIRKAFNLAKQVMSVGVMLYGPDTPGKPFRDGFLTSRNTFQKYFSQPEFKDYLEHVLNEEVFMVGPGVAIVFKDKTIQQRFTVDRYRTSGVAARLLIASRKRISHDPIEAAKRRIAKKQIISEEQFAAAKPLMDSLWSLCLELGRYPEVDEIGNVDALKMTFASVGMALRQIADRYDQALLISAQRTRKDDLLLFFAMQQFARRPAYKTLEIRLQRDIKAFFGDYAKAQHDGMRLLLDAADRDKIMEACVAAAEFGLGFLNGQQSLLIHLSLIERLPVVLRAYIACGLFVYESVSDIQLIKIHIDSGKLTLLQYEDFDTSATPVLTKRILDPIIDYYGAIRLTYGFCSPALSKLIHARVAPKLDQHAAHETNLRGVPICDRLGAACDFIVEDENMREVADWIIANLPFDRLYFYGEDRPLHLSFGPQNSRAAYSMQKTLTGAVVPRRYETDRI